MTRPGMLLLGVLLLGCPAQDDFVGRVVYDGAVGDDGTLSDDAGAMGCDPATALERLGIQGSWAEVKPPACTVPPLQNLSLDELTFFLVRVLQVTPANPTSGLTTRECETGAYYVMPADDSTAVSCVDPVSWLDGTCSIVLCPQRCTRTANDVAALVDYGCNPAVSAADWWTMVSFGE